MRTKSKKPVYAIKFRNYCKDHGITAKQIALILGLNYKTVYAYWAGEIEIADTYKKVLEKELNIPIYDIFFNESFDKVATIVYTKRGA